MVPTVKLFAIFNSGAALWFHPVYHMKQTKCLY